MKIQYEVIRVSGIDNLVDIFSKFGSSWIFRGQMDSNWNIESSLERFLKPIGFSDFARKLEDYFISEFRARAHHYVSRDMLPKTKLGWLSLMQHHGVPTRLIDFTEAPFIALFFAFDGHGGAGNDAAVWAFDFSKIDNDSFDYLKRFGRLSEDYEWVKSNRDEAFDKYVDGNSHELLWVTEPDLHNLRLENQKGTFLLSGKLDKAAMDYLEEGTSDCKAVAKKLVIPGCFRSEVFRLLNSMGIDNRRIYPGLDGLAKDVTNKFYFEIADKVINSRLKR
ncbi:FRG domain-containing protein [Dechloromonas denitrificans]|uniref:FRG domain-containing protein n=1 Tax=Dechloromonas denitrificans TaxID=281362 RepID=UPI0009FA1FD6|nr:FRG domain-containing protein [Dechloromonas denitrificans]